MTINNATRAILFLVIAFLNAACSNDLNLVKPGDPFPIVYGIVNPCDSFCYVTVSKTIAPEANATSILDNTRQLKLDDADIILEAFGAGYKLWETRFSLVEHHYMESDITQIPRSCFRSDRMLLFPDISLFESNDKWEFDYLRLQIASPQLANIAYARIPVILGPRKISPRDGSSLNFYNMERNSFIIKIDSSGTKYISFICTCHISEYSDHWEEKSVQFVVKKNLPVILDKEKKLTIRLYEEFFNLLAAAIPDNPNIFARRFWNMEFKLICGDRYFDDYLDTYVNVSSHDMRVYTNITNGYGIFSISRSVVFQKIEFDQQTLDTLSSGRLTKHLKFNRW